MRFLPSQEWSTGEQESIGGFGIVVARHYIVARRRRIAESATLSPTLSPKTKIRRQKQNRKKKRIIIFMSEFMLANIPWVALAVFSATGLIWTLIRDGAKLIDHADAVLLIKRDKGIFVDMRTAADFAGGRIAQARNIPAAELKNRAAEIDRYREKPVILVCQNGIQSRRQTRDLSDLGFLHVRAMRGGMSAWMEAQLPVFKK